MLEDIIQERLKKRDNFIKAGYDLYPSQVKRGHLISEVRRFFCFRFLMPVFFWRKRVSVAGRITGMRNQGKVFFLDLKDESGKIQAVVAEKNVKDYKLFRENLDIGDFVTIGGNIFKTKQGEESILVKDLVIAAKSLRPLPSQWHGLKDVEERFRRRYLDLIFNPEIKEKLTCRSEMVACLRDILVKKGFLEVETPMLQPIPGGARARPFKTHHNALNADFYLRIAPELYLKRLLVGGYEKVFEIGRNFRNEGMDRDHNPEFTMLELYWAYQDYRGLMKFIEELLGRYIKRPWKQITFTNSCQKYGGKNYKDLNKRDLDEFYKHEVRPKIKEPTLVIDYPEAIMPLAKHKEGNSDLTESFQLIVNGAEVVKGFSEMNDPLAQRKQMEEQEKNYRAGEEEATRLDEDFLEALEYGMPPAAGLGIGIDRLAALVTNTHAVKEIIAFPTLKPK